MNRKPIQLRRFGAAWAMLALALAACTGGDASPGATGGGGSSDGRAASGDVVMISSQLVPTEEQEKTRNEILAGYEVVSRPRIITWLRRTFAVAFVALGARLAQTER